MIYILLFLFIFPLFFSPFVLGLFGLSKINGTLFFISRLLYWIGLALLYLYCVKAEKQKMLIWEDRRYPFSIYIASIIIIFAVLFVGLGFIRFLYSFTSFSKTSEKLIEIANLFRQNKFLLVFSALTAGVTEEIIFRGYLQPRFQIIFKKPFCRHFSFVWFIRLIVLWIWNGYKYDCPVLYRTCVCILLLEIQKYQDLNDLSFPLGFACIVFIGKKASCIIQKFIFKIIGNFKIIIPSLQSKKIKMRRVKYYIISKSWISQNMVNPFAAHGMDWHQPLYINHAPQEFAGFFVS